MAEALTLSGLVMLTVLLLGYGLFYDRLWRRSPYEKRLAAFLGEPQQTARGKATQSNKQSVSAALAELEALRKERGRTSMRLKLRRAGLNRTVRAHYLRIVLWTVLAMAVMLILGRGLVTLALVAVIVGVVFPRFHLNWLIRRKQRAMTADMPAALDVIVRGIRSGLPLIECFKLTAREGRDPLRSEFIRMLNDLEVGMTIDEAVHRFARRVPTQEAAFFAIVIGIQSKAGGNLSEGLANLSDMLREREKLAAKIRTMSAEAKTSAWIIGLLPVAVSATIYFTTPGFIAVFFETTKGNLILAGCLLWMAIGVFVMRQMIQIDM